MTAAIDPTIETPTQYTARAEALSLMGDREAMQAQALPAPDGLRVPTLHLTADTTHARYEWRVYGPASLAALRRLRAQRYWRELVTPLGPWAESAQWAQGGWRLRHPMYRLAGATPTPCPWSPLLGVEIEDPLSMLREWGACDAGIIEACEDLGIAHDASDYELCDECGAEHALATPICDDIASVVLTAAMIDYADTAGYSALLRACVPTPAARPLLGCCVFIADHESAREILGDDDGDDKYSMMVESMVAALQRGEVPYYPGMLVHPASPDQWRWDPQDRTLRLVSADVHAPDVVVRAGSGYVTIGGARYKADGDIVEYTVPHAARDDRDAALVSWLQVYGRATIS